MGFRLMTNFDRPYHTTTIADFWKKWHISLSTWFRDYLYITLGGNRVSLPRVYFNLFFVFLVSGFWHGANWTFIVWGALHGTYLIVALLTKPIKEKLSKLLSLHKIPNVTLFFQRIINFVLVTLAWVFFRANNMSDATYIFSKISCIPAECSTILHTHKLAFLNLPNITNLLIPGLLVIIALETAHALQRRFQLEVNFSKLPLLFRWTVYYSCLFALLFLGVYEKHSFIYFQF